jgi:hypothetical protein
VLNASKLTRVTSESERSAAIASPEPITMAFQVVQRTHPPDKETAVLHARYDW